MKREERAAKIRNIKHGFNSPKSALLQVARQLEEVSPSKADQLMRLIGRIEEFQNKL